MAGSAQSMPRHHDHDRDPSVGIGYRRPIHDWTVGVLDRFDVLEMTIDHFLVGGPRYRSAATWLSDRIPLVAHGVGLSLGSAVPPDPHYLDRVAQAIETLGIPSYSEHLAFTKLPGLDLANLLPLPRTEEAAEHVIRNVNVVRGHVPVPFLLENITYYFDYPEASMSEAEFLSLICRETGAKILLDVENVRINSRNHGFDPRAFIDSLPAGAVKGIHPAGGTVIDGTIIDSLPAGAVKGIHTAGGTVIDGTIIDSHDHPVSDETMELLGYVLRRHDPETIILERDRRLRETDDLLPDVARIREVVGQARRREDMEDDASHPSRTSA